MILFVLTVDGISTKEMKMGLRNVLLGTALSCVFAANASFAEDVALVVGNEAYRNFNPVANARAVISTADAFEDAGYTVLQVTDGSEAQIKAALDQFERLHGEADRVVVVLSGHFMTSGSATWFAPVDLQSPSFANLGFDGLPLSSVLSFLGEKAGGAALFLGQDITGTPVDAPIKKGIGTLSIPQGVTVATGTPRAVRRALENQFLATNTSVRRAAERSPDLEVSGFVSDHVALNGASVGAVQEEAVVDLNVPAALQEEAFWQAVDAIGSKASYEAYLRRYPAGEFAEQADEMLRVIADATPKYTPEEQAELNMALTRNDRRRVQEQLSLLEFDPRGIDGVFGPGSRGAIRRFQAQNGLNGDGYMNPETLKRLRSQAERRAAQLAEEAERAKRKRDAADVRFWSQTGARGTEADYLAYLKKYPRGLYADAAKDALRRIEQDNRATAEAAERAAWDIARDADSIKAYRAFLAQYPDGAFAKLARGRIEELSVSDENRVELEKAKREEESLRMSPAMKLLIERKLRAVGLNPGKQDGRFTQQTRDAIRQYQVARGLADSGYITRRTVVRLMSE